MKQTKYLKIEITGTKKSIAQYFEFIATPIRVKITELKRKKCKN